MTRRFSNLVPFAVVFGPTIGVLGFSAFSTRKGVRAGGASIDSANSAILSNAASITPGQQGAMSEADKKAKLEEEKAHSQEMLQGKSSCHTRAGRSRNLEWNSLLTGLEHSDSHAP
ncbi:hypothetical protein TI39_contig611g00004 [Zymoseptoria brevis]|uniref:Uncharacterized protein n=1 Tax=Zymoseptoria brevis TaxID=1047168 RepID=A0A0F4GGX9_9PEZI|nr:hypothetical protein TI39_contig611g00004 [Zymoseptoria brevis]